MPKTSAFDTCASEYDAWFERHPYVYKSELAALRRLTPTKGKGVEIGVGTGRFALPLGVTLGVDPSQTMRHIAAVKGLETMAGVAEALPLEDEEYDYALFVTTICFLDSLEKALCEAHRILKPGGVIVIGFIDRNSPLGKHYATHRKESGFYKGAVFHTVAEVRRSLHDAGFEESAIVQTLFKELDEIVAVEPVKQGFGEGSFVVVRAHK